MDICCHCTKNWFCANSTWTKFRSVFFGRDGRKRMRVFSDGFDDYVEYLKEVWGTNINLNGWLRIELRVTTRHSCDWRELHFGCFLFWYFQRILISVSNRYRKCCRLLLHLLFKTPLIDSLGFVCIHWRDYADYLARLLSWGRKVMAQCPVDISPDTYVIRPAKRGLFISVPRFCN